MQVLLERDTETLLLKGPPLARGGEATIFSLTQRPDQVAKVYHQPTALHGLKLAAMLAAPPSDPMAASGHVSIAWPLDRLLAPDETGACLGYIMPRVHKARLLLEFYNPRARLKQCPLFNYTYLLRTARNLAAAVRAIHQRGYVIGDLNESNVLVSNTALVTLVDTDSFQVRGPTQVHRCPVGKPEYTPPELQGVRFSEIDRAPEHDAFALAVLIFQLLMQGIHPFAGRFTGQGDPASLAERIAAGHWPYAQARQVPYAPSPHAPPLAVLPPLVQNLMRRCFEEGHAQPALRPPAAAWHSVLQHAEKDLTTCPANEQHVYHRGLDACPWCRLARLQKQDPFPSRSAIQAASAVAAGVTALPALSPTLVAPLSGSGDPTVALPPPAKPAPAAGQKAVSTWIDHSVPVTSSQAPAPAPVRAPVSAPPAPRNYDAWVWLIGLLALALLGLFIAQPFAVNPDEGPEANPAPENKKDEKEPVDPPPPKKAAAGQEATRALTEVRQLAGHAGEVLCVALAPDGRHALSGGKDRSVRLWDVAAGREERRLDGHNGAVCCVAFGLNSRGLSGGEDRTIVLWDLLAFRELGRYEGHTLAVRSVACSPDGSYFVSGSDDGNARVWDVETGEVLRRLEGHVGSVRAVAYAPDGRRVLTGGEDQSVRLWDAKTGRELQRFPGHSGPVWSVAIDNEGRRALSGSADKTVRLWDLESGKQLQVFEGHREGVGAVAFTLDGRVVSGSLDRTVRLWKVRPEERAWAGRHDGAVCGVAVTRDDRLAVTCSADRSLRVWDLPRP
jgi:hypothetical protein